MFSKIKEWLFGPHNPNQTQTVAANTAAIQAQGDVNVSGVPYKVTLPVTTDPLSVKEWPFPGSVANTTPKPVGKQLAEAAKSADAATPAKKPRKPRAKKAAK